MTATPLRPGVFEGRATIVGARDTRIDTLAGEHARAAGAALENLASTPAAGWARCGVRATGVGRGRTADDDVGALGPLLASAGGECFSGRSFGLR